MNRSNHSKAHYDLQKHNHSIFRCTPYCGCCGFPVPRPVWHAVAGGAFDASAPLPLDVHAGKQSEDAEKVVKV